MISMGAGEYLATKSQEEVFAAEMALEAQHLEEHRDHERDELRHMFGDMGLDYVEKVLTGGSRSGIVRRLVEACS